jgi:2-oxo-3-hexenedioate decarboxylase
MTPASIEALARAQLDAYESRSLIDPPSTSDPSFGLAKAYQVLARIRAERLRRGERMVGRKIGFTNRNIWPEYGVDSPIWAPVYDTTLVDGGRDPGAFSLARTLSPRIEPEIAFGLRSGVRSGLRDLEAILEAVEWVAPAFEVVDCFHRDWRFRVQDTVAQQGLHAALIVGARVALDPKRRADWASRLETCRASLYRDGELADSGIGANALGHPALALAFLADLLAGQPQFEPLAAGEIVTTGTLTAALPIAARQTWRFELDGIELAPLSVRFQP